MVLVLGDAESDGEGDFDEDEGELDPERAAEGAVFAVVDPKTLVFGADEDGGDDIAGAAGYVSVECHDRMSSWTYTKTTNSASCALG